jgi:hypothetical protein
MDDHLDSDTSRLPCEKYALFFVPAQKTSRPVGYQQMVQCTEFFFAGAEKIFNSNIIRYYPTTCSRSDSTKL